VTVAAFLDLMQQISPGAAIAECVLHE